MPTEFYSGNPALTGRAWWSAGAGRGFLAFLFYRWEVILRETAILGILGVATLGFYIDSAFEDIRFDVALVLILITASLNICVDMISRGIRARLRLTTTPDL